ncbi:ZIP family metal transporter [Konateibacter massiliensis]|uniref:ZIP family metal transporter n=1 Tax=Konateibacter massiliensis TaxID=2002841 RepID=UPI000C150073|nr:ZIP family metal transporter [Konateibacter massiliensis]
MNDFIKTMLIIGLSGLFTEWLGLFLGGTASLFIKDKGIRMKGSVLGFLGGLTLGIVFFDLLPEAVDFGNIYISITGAFLGLVLAVILDGKLENHEDPSTSDKSGNLLKAAIFMAIGISIHNLPSGLALGSLLYHSPQNGIYLAIALILHGIPEGLTLGILFREGKKSKLTLLLISILISLPTGLGSSLGCILSSPFLICISLSFAAAMMLYVTLRETLPTANDLWKGRLTTIGNVLGIILGMLFVYVLEG